MADALKSSRRESTEWKKTTKHLGQPRVRVLSILQSTVEEAVRSLLAASHRRPEHVPDFPWSHASRRPRGSFRLISSVWTLLKFYMHMVARYLRIAAILFYR